MKFEKIVNDKYWLEYAESSIDKSLTKINEGAIVTTEIDSLDSESQRVTFYQNIYKVQENEILNLNIPIKPLPQKVIVSTAWIENNEEKGFTQTLKNK